MTDNGNPVKPFEINGSKRKTYKPVRGERNLKTNYSGKVKINEE